MEVEYRDKYAVVTLPEKIAIFKGADELKKVLLTLCDEGFSTIVLDFRDLIMIDTSGLRHLLVFQHRLKSMKGSLKIINITSQYIRDMFETIELYKVISIEGMNGE